MTSHSGQCVQYAVINSLSARTVCAVVYQERSPPLPTYLVSNAIQLAKIAQDPHNLIVPFAIQLLIHLLLSSTQRPNSVNLHAQITSIQTGRILHVLNVLSDAHIAQVLQNAKYAMTKQTRENFMSHHKEFNLVPASKVTTKILSTPKTTCASSATFPIVWLATVLGLAHFATI
jgi:hypothetical protein